MNGINEQKFINQGKVAYKLFVKHANLFYADNRIVELKELSLTINLELRSLLTFIDNLVEYNKIRFLYTRVQKFKILLDASKNNEAFCIINDYKN